MDNKTAAYQECDEKLKELQTKFQDIEAQMKKKIDAADNIKVGCALSKKNMRY